MNHSKCWFIDHRTHDDFLKTQFVDYDYTLKTFTQSLYLQVTAPLAILKHRLDILVKRTVLIFVQKWSEKLLVFGHVSTGLLAHEFVGLSLTVNLIGEGSEQAIAVASDISQLDPQYCNFLIKFREIVDILLVELKLISFAHFLPQSFLNFHVFLTIFSFFLDILSLIFLSTHLSTIK